MSEIRENEKVTLNNEITLLPHNQMLYDKIVAEINNGERSIFYSEATGLGKSFIFMKLVQEYFSEKKVLYIVPKIAIWHNLTNYKEFSTLTATVEMTTFAAFNKYSSDSEMWNEYDAVFVDECHHMLSDIQGVNVAMLLEDMKTHNKYSFGMTATPYYKGTYVDEVWFDVSCYGYDVFEAIEVGILPKVKLALASIDLDSVPSNLKAQFSITGTKPLLNRLLEEHSDIKKWFAYFANKNVLEQNVREMQMLFPDYEILKVYEGVENEEEVYNRFESTERKVVLMSVNKLLEGIHLKGVEGVLLYRNVAEFSTYMQMYGRLCSVCSKTTPVFLDVTNAIISINKVSETKSSRYIGERRKHNRKDLFDVNASDYWTVELADTLREYADNTWKDEELDIIRQYYRKIPNQELLDMLSGRTWHSIQAKAHQLGVTGNKPWTKEEDDIIRSNIKLSNEQLTELLPDRNLYAVKRRKAIIGLTKDAYATWTEEELNILKQCNHYTWDELQALLPNRTKSAINTLRKKLGYEPPKRKTSIDVIWDEDELQILRDNYPSVGSKCFSMIPGKTESQCAGMVFRMGIKKEQKDNSLLFDYIVNNYKKESNKSIAEKFGVTPNVVQKIATQQGITASIGPNVEWTEEMDKFLIDNAKTMRRVDIGEILGVTEHSVKNRLQKLGIKYRDWNYWSDEEIDRLTKLYKSGESIEKISKVLGHASSSVNFKLKTLGLK